MSDPFQRVMRDLNELLKVTYNADKVVILPGSRTSNLLLLCFLRVPTEAWLPIFTAYRRFRNL
jgi:lipid A disaccharide synthetase